MYKSIAVLVAVFMLGETALGQVNDSFRQRCEDIIVDSINESKSLMTPSHVTLRRARLVPIEKTQEFLLASLANEDKRIRFAAAHILAEESAMEFAEPISTMLSKLKLGEEFDVM